MVPSESLGPQKRLSSSALELGPRKKQTTQDLLVHHGHHFGRAVHCFCNIQTLVTNGIALMGERADEPEEILTSSEHREYGVFCGILQMVPGLEAHLMTLSEEEVIHIADLIQKGANGACADDMKGMKTVIVDWITPKGQSLNPHIPCNMKSSRDQWPVFLYANYTYDAEDPWNGLLHGGLLIAVFKHIFTSPSSVDQEPKATCSGNARLHGMRSVTKVSITYIATQARFALTSAQVFSQTDLVTDSERFYNSILKFLDDPEEKDEVDQLLV
ncbi:hypothetical protein BDN67DRAFT_991796 [Paxillus ammoniavirescens]|nr:hypothetical protein BDN67DRAFT_991796 [Paxillus ammoniavirescens]